MSQYLTFIGLLPHLSALNRTQMVVVQCQLGNNVMHGHCCGKTNCSRFDVRSLAANHTKPAKVFCGKARHFRALARLTCFFLKLWLEFPSQLEHFQMKPTANGLFCTGWVGGEFPNSLAVSRNSNGDGPAGFLHQTRQAVRLAIVSWLSRVMICSLGLQPHFDEESIGNKIHHLQEMFCHFRFNGIIKISTWVSDSNANQRFWQWDKRLQNVRWTVHQTVQRRGFSFRFTPCTLPARVSQFVHDLFWGRASQLRTQDDRHEWQLRLCQWDGSRLRKHEAHSCAVPSRWRGGANRWWPVRSRCVQSGSFEWLWWRRQEETWQKKEEKEKRQTTVGEKQTLLKWVSLFPVKFRWTRWHLSDDLSFRPVLFLNRQVICCHIHHFSWSLLCFWQAGDVQSCFLFNQFVLFVNQWLAAHALGDRRSKMRILPWTICHTGKKDGRGLSDEEMLLEELFSDYNPSARPVIDSSSTVPVQIQFSLMHIKDLVSESSTILVRNYADSSILGEAAVEYQGSVLSTSGLCLRSVCLPVMQIKQRRMLVTQPTTWDIHGAELEIFLCLTKKTVKSQLFMDHMFCLCTES